MPIFQWKCDAFERNKALLSMIIKTYRNIRCRRLGGISTFAQNASNLRPLFYMFTKFFATRSPIAQISSESCSSTAGSFWGLGICLKNCSGLKLNDVVRLRSVEDVLRFGESLNKYLAAAS